MYQSPIGKPSLRVGLLMGLLIGLSSLLLLAACGVKTRLRVGLEESTRRHERWHYFHRRSDRLSPLLRS